MKQMSICLALLLSLTILLCACSPLPEAAVSSVAPDTEVPLETGDADAVDLGAGPAVSESGAAQPAEQPAEEVSDEPVVYFTQEITPEGLLAVYEMAEWAPVGPVAVKVSTGESENSNYLRPALIADLVQSVNGTIVECNTAYGGNRSSTEDHLRLADEHGFTAVAPVVIQDAAGSLSIPVTGGSRLREDLVGAAFEDFGSYIILSHFKGHAMAGYGGAIKNMSIGLASADGKALIHSGGTSTTDVWGGEQDAFLEAMAEAAKGVADRLGDRIVYINVMNRLSVDCDCDASPAEPDMHDIGILASADPVALDQACVDLIYAADDGSSVVERIESRDGLHALEHAEEIGLGSRSYALVDISA